VKLHSRRDVNIAIAASIPMSFTGALHAQNASQAAGPSAANLSDTKLINCSNARIQKLARQIAAQSAEPQARAVAIHNWVRDQIKFAIPGAFYQMAATDVLEAGIGYCNTKCTLFAALLRAINIPTRLRMLDLPAQVLNGLFDPGTGYVDHGITEVWLGDAWHALDSYVVDSALERGARRRLSAEARQLGYGICLDGSSIWSGIGDQFIQAPRMFDSSIHVHGYFDDIADFYGRVPTARNRKTVATSLFLR
jgi:Transglutaminase-like superfamily